MTIISDYLSQQPVLTLMLLAHVLADFHFQSQEMADKKVFKGRYLYKHYLGVFLPMIILIILAPNFFGYYAMIWVSHVVIDYVKCSLDKLIKRKNATVVAFLVDQFCHLACIVLLYFFFRTNHAPQYLYHYYQWLQLALFLALITKPINIVFKIVFQKYQVKETEDKSIKGAGAVIGNLERLATALFLLMGQIPAIGLIFTAKSIARYDKISKSQAFAEYYLIGSLFSIIAVIISYLIIYGW
ncbi:DUF3307 domain-containing protein [Streptococcus pacificus]|uniref:DUF3307 domain-containing protein n=1 Tax=Streptococcus pacificus TaxID=2740577 RepID=A0ABS0ZHQ6_9STRE|nr:DUF3307 domain-containing protein [Streptococcus pacificus]MBJ8325541.1 DUF3307 domain-containing protein [Streptococcus pacificus]